MPTLIHQDKFDTGGTWNLTEGSPTIGSSPATPIGGNSVELNPAAAAESIRYNVFDNTQSRVVVGLWVRFSAFSSSGESRFIGVWGGTGTTFGLMRILPSGSTGLIGDGTPTIPNAYRSGADLSLDTWYWMQMMFDKTADPWELRGNIEGFSVWNTTATATAGTFPSTAYVKIGTDLTTNTYTMYVGYLKIGTAASDDDWWEEPSGDIGKRVEALSWLGS